jgi:RHS repeat-associated protein
MTPNRLLRFVSQMLPVRCSRQAKTKSTKLLFAIIAASAALAVPQAAEAQLSTYSYTGPAFSVPLCGAAGYGSRCVNGNITGTVIFSGLPSGYTGYATIADIASFSFTANGIGFSITSATPHYCSASMSFTFSSGSIVDWYVALLGDSCSSPSAQIVTGNPPAFGSYADDAFLSPSSVITLIGISPSTVGTWSLSSAPAPTPDKTLGDPDARTGGCGCADPIDITTGNVFEKVVDYTTPGQNPLAFTRYYNSMAITTGVTPLASTLGANWRSNFDRYLNIISSSEVLAERPNGQILTFTLSGSTWTSDTDVDVTLTNSGSTWTLTDHDDTVETYDTVTGPLGPLSSVTFGQLSKIQARNGYTQTPSYNSSNQLTSVADSYGRSLSFTYSSGLLATVTAPDTLGLGYGFTAAGGSNVLTSVSYSAASTSISYAYANTSFPFALTSLTDELGHTHSTWTYDSYGRAASNYMGGSTLSANSTTITYGSGTSMVTNALGVADTYTLTTSQGVPKITGISRAATTGSGATAAATESFSYDSNGYLASKTDWNDGTHPYNTTNYNNDSHGDPEGSSAIVEAYGTSVVRTTGITYDSTWVHLPHCITTTGNTVAFVYTSTSIPADLQTRAETDTASGGTACATSSATYTRVWTNTWGTTTGTGANIGLLTSVTDPLSRVTSYAYSPTNSANTAQLTSIADPNTVNGGTTIHHVTGFAYNSSGVTTRPATITDPNSVVTSLAYDARLNLHTSTLDPTGSAGGPYLTTYAHDAANNLTQVTLPDSSYLAYTLDAANRLTKVTNANSEYISYTLDALGDRTASNIYNASSTLTRKHTAGFDNLGRILTDNAWTATGSSCTTSICNTTTYVYDANGNATSITDPRGHTTTQTFDALNRLHQVTDRLSHTTTTAYDAHNAVTSVQDPNSNTTTYTRDGFERVKQLASPDSGTSNYYYDLANNLTQKTDGAGVSTYRTFDALNRELTQCFTSGCSSYYISKIYDQTGYGYSVGHLTTMYDAGQTLSIEYDERGNDIGEIHTLGTYNFTTYKYYDNAGRLYGLVNPDGYTVGWNRDAAGQVNSIGFVPPSSSTITYLVGNGSSTFITHEPFGPAISLPFQNGITRTNTYDLDYKLTNATDSGTSTVLNQSYSYDANGNPNCITDTVNAANSQIMTYDNMDRVLTAASGASSCATGSGGGYGSYVWTWDANGNRASQKLNGGTTDNYTYGTGINNQVTATSYSGFGFGYNGAGEMNAVSQSGSSLSCEALNQPEQLASVTFAPCSTNPPAASFEYDGFGQRLVKSAAVATAYFYGGFGNLTEETNTVGQTTDYIPLDPSSPRDAFYPVAMLGVPGISSAAYGAYYVHADRLGTPQLVTGPGTSQTVQWSTTYAPFGLTGTITNPNSITQNLRLPGMYSDPETGLYHNGAREYDPTVTGRYLQTDPIGLNGGTNTYQYARSNPFAFTDPKGKQAITAIARYLPYIILSGVAISVAGAWEDMVGADQDIRTLPPPPPPPFQPYWEVPNACTPSNPDGLPQYITGEEVRVGSFLSPLKKWEIEGDNPDYPEKWETPIWAGRGLSYPPPRPE